MNSLPSDLLVLIFSFCPSAALPLVCTYFQKLAPPVLKHYLLLDYSRHAHLAHEFARLHQVNSLEYLGTKLCHLELDWHGLVPPPTQVDLSEFRRLKFIRTGAMFNAALRLPPALEHLHLGSNFNQELLVPPTLRTLIMGRAFTQTLQLEPNHVLERIIIEENYPESRAPRARRVTWGARAPLNELDPVTEFLCFRSRHATAAFGQFTELRTLCFHARETPTQLPPRLICLEWRTTAELPNLGPEVKLIVGSNLVIE